MGIVIGPDVIHSMDIMDPISRVTVRLFFRTPTTEERVNYQAGLIKVTGGRKPRVQGRHIETRQKYGRAIITGIRPGDVAYQDDAGQVRDLADLPAEDAAEKLTSWLPHVVETLAFQVFEGARVMEEDTEDEAEDDDENP